MSVDYGDGKIFDRAKMSVDYVNGTIFDWDKNEC